MPRLIPFFRSVKKCTHVFGLLSASKEPGLIRSPAHRLQENLKAEQMILHKKCGPIKHLCCADPGGRSLEMVRQIADIGGFFGLVKAGK